LEILFIRPHPVKINDVSIAVISGKTLSIKTSKAGKTNILPEVIDGACSRSNRFFVQTSKSRLCLEAAYLYEEDVGCGGRI
tara:strand:+ start:302 stop:544 length:243 start_codon:yes stop_codon:yes gene_type:complete